MRVGLVIVVLAGLLAGCDESRAVSERGRFELNFGGLQTEAWGSWTAPYLVVQGTRLCPVVRCDACQAEGSCEGVMVRASGPLHADGACFVAEAPGVSEWQVGAPCDEGDSATITVVAADEVGAEVGPWTDRFAADLAIQGGEFAPELPAPLRVIAGSQLHLDVRLSRREDGHTVGWADGEVSVATTSGRAPVVYPGSALELVVFADTVAEVSFRVAASTWSLGQVMGVPESSAHTLALAVASEEGGTTPIAARAEVRDAQGRVLLGLPVTWSLTDGALAAYVDPIYPGPDWVALADECVPPEARGGPHMATLRGERGALAAELSLRWTGVAGEPEPGWQKPEQCAEDGCGCRSRSGGPGLPGLLGLLGLLRRRGR